MILDTIHEPADLRELSYPELDEPSPARSADFIVQAVAARPAAISDPTSVPSS